MNGNLFLRLINAKLIRDTELIGKMSPYVKIISGGIIEKSPVAKKGHLTPTWEWEVTIPITNASGFVMFEAYCQEHIQKDKLIGSCQFNLSQLQQNKFRGWIPLSYEGADAGALFVDMSFDSSDMLLNKNLSGSSLSSDVSMKTSNLATSGLAMGATGGGMGMGSTMMETAVTTQPLEPIVHENETLVVKEEPVIYKDKPIVYEKTIITEKPLIHEKQIIYKEQPIIVEQPELHERQLYHQEAPVVTREEPVYSRDDMRSNIENLDAYGAPIIQKEVEYRREAPIYTKEQPQVFEKNIVTEKPIIRQKDIINVEKPVIVEKAEFREKPIQMTKAPILEKNAPLITSETSRNINEMDENPIVHSTTEMRKEAPVFQKERPEVYETKVIHEKPIIHEQPVIFTEQTVVQEKPEIHEKKIFHQEPTKVIQEETVYRKDGENVNKKLN